MRSKKGIKCIREAKGQLQKFGRGERESRQDLIVPECSLIYNQRKLEFSRCSTLATVMLQTCGSQTLVCRCLVLWQVLHSHFWLSVRSLRVCNGCSVILRFDTS